MNAYYIAIISFFTFLGIWVRCHYRYKSIVELGKIQREQLKTHRKKIKGKG
jgi:hypothetical protein